MKTSQTFLIGLVAFLVLGIGGYVAWEHFRNPPIEFKQVETQSVREEQEMNRKKEMGFKEALKNPEEWQNELNDRDQSLSKAIESAKRWDDEKIEHAVGRYVFEAPSKNDAWMEYQVLKSLGTKTHAPILRILGDPSLGAKLLEQTTKKNSLPEAPFNRACGLLEDDPPGEAAALVIPFLEEKSDEIRKSAAILLGSIGSAPIVVPIRKALSDDDEYVRSYALMGLQRAIKSNRLSDDCPRELFVDMQKLLTEGKNCDKAANVLLAFDRERADSFFLSEALFSPDARALHETLRAMKEVGITVPRDRLLKLLDGLKDKELKYPQTYQLGEILQALGKHRNPEDRKTIEKFLTSEERIVADGAAKGMLSLHGLEGFDKKIWDILAKRGSSALTVPQRHYNAVFMLDAEVNNGGFSQYFFNSSGDDWKSAVEGLKAMEFDERLTIVQEALAKFGKAGPSADRETRMNQLAKIERANDRTFGEFDSRYYKSKENITVLAMCYVLKNPEAFR